MANLQTYDLASGATGITDLTEIGKVVKDTALWTEIQDKVAKVSADIQSGAIDVINAQIGETFDPASCANVTIK